jgi:hypothetical protein
MNLPEDNAGSHQGKDAEATVVTGRGAAPAYGKKSPWLARVEHA